MTLVGLKCNPRRALAQLGGGEGTVVLIADCLGSRTGQTVAVSLPLLLLAPLVSPSPLSDPLLGALEVFKQHLLNLTMDQ